VATEVDFEVTYVGGDDQLIDDLLGHPDLEVQRVPPTPA
jgi:hypothetical protein